MRGTERGLDFAPLLPFLFIAPFFMISPQFTTEHTETQRAQRKTNSKPRSSFFVSSALAFCFPNAKDAV